MAEYIVPVQRIERAIVMLRGHKVMLDEDLAALYQVDVKVLNQAVKRNSERLLEDFMFQLTARDPRTHDPAGQAQTTHRVQKGRYMMADAKSRTQPPIKPSTLASTSNGMILSCAALKRRESTRYHVACGFKRPPLTHAAGICRIPMTSEFAAAQSNPIVKERLTAKKRLSIAELSKVAEGTAISGRATR